MVNVFDPIGGASDPWQNLMSFGLNTMAAANKRTPEGFLEYGTGSLGAIGAGGQAAMDNARQNSMARVQMQSLGADAQSKYLQNMLSLNQVNAWRKLSGQEPLSMPGGGLPGAAQPIDTSQAAKPTSSAAGMPFSPTAGASVANPDQNRIERAVQPADGGNSMAIRPEVMQGAAIPSRQEAIQLANVYAQAGNNAMAQHYMDVADSGIIEGSKKAATFPYDAALIDATPRPISPNESIMKNGQIIATGVQEGVTPEGAGYRIPARMANNPSAQPARALAVQAANEVGVDPHLYQGVVLAENAGRTTNNVSSAGAMGAAQLMPGTARDLGVDPTVPKENVRGGAIYLKQQMDKYQNPTLALMAYNWGPGNVDNWISKGASPSAVPKETREYISKVNLNTLSSQFGGGEQQPTAPNMPQGAMQTSISPTEKAFAEGRGKALSDRMGEIDEHAEAAKQANFLLDQMKMEADNFRMGKWSDFENNSNKFLRLINPKYDGTVGSFEAFTKNAITLTNEEVRQVSSRAAVQEYTAIQGAQPQPEMSPEGFKQIINQKLAINDYKLAKQTARDQWLETHRTPEGFETEFNKNVSPAVFLVSRLDEQQLVGMRNNLLKREGGEKIIGNLMKKLSYAKQNGFLE